jgi:DNA-binding MarR family transcriptional regulator
MDNNNKLWDELVKAVGEKQASVILDIFAATDNEGPPTGPSLTPRQRTVLNYLRSGKPITSQRRLAEACGMDHPQKLVAAIAGLTMKGYLVPKKDE